MILPLRVFGSSGVKTMFAGFAIGPILRATWSRSSSSLATEPSASALERDEGDDRLAGHRVGARGDGRLGDVLVVDERALDLDRRDAVAGDVHDVVDPAEQPEVAVLVDPRAVAGEVDVAVLRPVGLAVALVVAVDAAQHRRPGPAQDEVAAAAGADLVAAPRCRPPRRPPGTAASPSRAWSSSHPGSGVIRIMPGLGLPPGVDDRAAVAADVLAVPDPGLGIDRLADRAEQAQRSRGRAARRTAGPHFMCVRIAVGAV